MDKLNTNLNGGFPFELDDLRWMATGIDRGFKGLADGIGNCILTGCEVTLIAGSDYSVAPGFVLWDGEVREMTGTTTEMLFGPAAYCLVPYDTLDPSGSETFEDLTVQNAYLRRRLIVAFDTGSNGLNLVNGPRLGDRIRELGGVGIPGAWHRIGEPGEPAFLNDYQGNSGASAVMFRLEPGGIVRLRGVLDATDVAEGTFLAAFVLPPGYRPASGTSITVALPTMTPGHGARVISIDAGGNVKVDIETGSPAGFYDRFNLGAFPTYFAIQ